MVEKIGSQIEQLDQKIDLEAPLLPSGIVTPPVGSPRQEVKGRMINGSFKLTA